MSQTASVLNSRTFCVVHIDLVQILGEYNSDAPEKYWYQVYTTFCFNSVQIKGKSTNMSKVYILIIFFFFFFFFFKA